MALERSIKNGRARIQPRLRSVVSAGSPGNDVSGSVFYPRCRARPMTASNHEKPDASFNPSILTASPDESVEHIMGNLRQGERRMIKIFTIRYWMCMSSTWLG